MKKICLLLSSFIVFCSFSQQTEYVLNSDVWDLDRTTNTITPKNGKGFDLPKKEFIQTFDTNKINEHLLNSMNEFRMFYGSPPVLEDKELTTNSKIYSKKLSESFQHDINLPKNNSEMITKINFILLTKVDTTKYDINKIIADCYFDIFVASPSHMKLLLDPNMTHYGFGLYQDKMKFNICVRGMKK